MDSKRLGWGVVGLGRIASTQVVPGIVASVGSSLVSVVSRDQGRAEEFAQKHGAARAFDDYATMLADPEVEAVYIATPNAQHAEQVIAAARAGKHVLCDKPLAVTVADARRCVEECRIADVRLGVTFQTRNHDGLAEAAELVRSGAIGTVVIAEVEMSAGRNLPRDWRTDPALAGLGTLNNIGVHAFDGTDGRILGRNLSRPGRAGTPSFITRDGEREFPATSHDAYQRTIEAFADAVRRGRDPSPSGEDGLRSVELTTAIAAAIREQRVISLRGADRNPH